MFESVFGKKHISRMPDGLKQLMLMDETCLLTVFPAGLDAMGMRGMTQVFMRRVSVEISDNKELVE